jgi:hypothetical protein
MKWDGELGTDYVPIAHAKIAGSYRTPMMVEKYNYALCIGKDKIRNFSEETLPDKIKATMTMIHAFPPSFREKWAINPIDAYINVQDKKLDDIGWQVTKNLYILILDQAFLGEMHGRHTREEG